MRRGATRQVKFRKFRLAICAASLGSCQSLHQPSPRLRLAPFPYRGGRQSFARFRVAIRHDPSTRYPSRFHADFTDFTVAIRRAFPLETGLRLQELQLLRASTPSRSRARISGARRIDGRTSSMPTMSMSPPSGSGDREARGTSRCRRWQGLGAWLCLASSRRPLSRLRSDPDQTLEREWDRLGVAGYRPRTPWANLSWSRGWDCRL